MTTKGWVGLVLLFTVAVPGVMFYQWYAHLDKAQKRELSLKVRSRIPDGGPFASSPNKNKLVNPIAAETQSPAAAPGAAESAPSAPDGGQGPAVLAGQAFSAANVPAASAPQDVRASTTSLPSALPAASSAPAVNPFLAWRDPTLSRYDMERLARMNMHPSRPTAKLPKKLPPKPRVEDTIHLQGIVSNPEGGGNRAIVNGESVGEGAMVGKVKVLRITPQTVVFGCDKIRFSKSVNR